MARVYIRRADELEREAERVVQGGAMTVLAKAGDFNGLAVAIFGMVLAVTLRITRWAARRTQRERVLGRRPRDRRPVNGIAIAGDYLSASTFLGYAGLMYLYGFDGWIFGLGALLSFLPVLYLLAERMRNAGKFTVADVLAFRLASAPCGSPPRSTRC